MRALDPLILPRAIIWALVLSVLSYTVADPDLWGHVRFGQDILQRLSIPSEDPYSFTSDRAWVNHEWLSEVVMAAAFQFGGSVGLSLLKLALLLFVVAVVSRELVFRRVPPVPRDVLVTIFVVSCVTLTPTLRPQTFSLALFALLLATLRRVDDGRGGLIWFVPVLMMVWANLHGGWLVGIGVLGAWTAVRCVKPRGAPRGIWASAGIVSLLATLVTPEGIGLWTFLYDTVGLGRADIAEWHSLFQQSPADALPWILTTIVAAIALWRARNQPLAHLVVVGLLLVTSFKVWRLAPFYALAGIVLLGPYAVRPAPPVTKPSPPAGALAVVIVGLMAAVAAGCAAFVSYRNIACIEMSGEWTADREAAAFIIDSGLSGRMLTWFNWGEYAIWFLSPTIKVSMDGRRETVYSDDVLGLHLAIYRGEPGWEDALKRLDPDHVWLPATVPTLPRIERMGWRRVFGTAQSIVLSRAGTLSPPSPYSPGSAPEACFPGRP